MDSVTLFLNSCRSLETRNVYQISLQKYIDFIGEDELFSQINPILIEAKIIEFILILKDQNKSYAAILNYLNAVKGYYKINDIILNVNKISKFLPEQMRVNKDRAYVIARYTKADDIRTDLERLSPDIYIINPRLPGKTGTEVATEILDIYPSAPILFITADNSPVEIKKHPKLRDKKVDVLLKPVKLEEIEHTILNLVHR